MRRNSNLEIYRPNPKNIPPPFRATSADRTNSGIPFSYEIDGRVSAKEIATLCLSATGASFKAEDWEDELAETYRHVTVRVRGPEGMLVGFVRANMDNDDPEKCIVDDAMIRSQYKGRGIFSKMVKLGLEQLREDGFSEVLFKNDAGTEKMYAHLGFLATGDGFSLDLQNRMNTDVSV